MKEPKEPKSLDEILLQGFVAVLPMIDTKKADKSGKHSYLPARPPWEVQAEVKKQILAYFESLPIMQDEKPDFANNLYADDTYSRNQLRAEIRKALRNEDS